MTDARHQLGKAQVEAHGADQLLQQLKPHFDDLEADYIRRWRMSEPSRHDVREDAWMMIRALDEVRSQLLTKAKGGAVAAFNLRRTIAAQSKRGI